MKGIQMNKKMTSNCKEVKNRSKIRGSTGATKPETETVLELNQEDLLRIAEKFSRLFSTLEYAKNLKRS